MFLKLSVTLHSADITASLYTQLFHDYHFNYQFRQVDVTACHTVTCGSTVVKVLCYKSEGRWFDPSW